MTFSVSNESVLSSIYATLHFLPTIFVKDYLTKFIFQITLTDAQIKAVEKKKAKPASDKTGDGLAPLDESEEQEVKVEFQT